MSFISWHHSFHVISLPPSLQERIDELTEQNTKLRRTAQRAKSDGTGAEIDDLRRDLARRDSQCKKLREKKQELEEEVDELEKKVQRMSTMAKQVRAAQTGLGVCYICMVFVNGDKQNMQ